MKGRRVEDITKGKKHEGEGNPSRTGGGLEEFKEKAGRDEWADERNCHNNAAFRHYVALELSVAAETSEESTASKRFC